MLAASGESVSEADGRRSSGSSAGRSVLYVDEYYPSLSETFVEAEIRGLLAQGWVVHSVALIPGKGASLQRSAIPPERQHAIPYRPSLRPLVAGVAAEKRKRERARTALWVALRDLERPTPRGLARAYLSLSQAHAVADLCGQLNVGHVRAHFLGRRADVVLLASILRPVRFSIAEHTFTGTADRGQKRVARRSSFMTGVSLQQVERLQALVDSIGARTPVWLLRNGVPLDDMPRRHGAGHTGPFRVLAVGRLHPQKGFDVLVEALARLGDTVEWDCRIVGEGQERGVLEMALRRHALADKITCVGALSREAVFHEMGEADLLVMPSVTLAGNRGDGIPTVVIEAMAIGLPVVATSAGAIPELVQDGVTGVLVRERDPRGLAAAIRQCAEDRWGLTRRATAARHVVEQEYDLRKTARRLSEMLEAGAPVARTVVSGHGGQQHDQV